MWFTIPLSSEIRSCEINVEYLPGSAGGRRTPSSNDELTRESPKLAKLSAPGVTKSHSPEHAIVLVASKQRERSIALQTNFGLTATDRSTFHCWLILNMLFGRCLFSRRSQSHEYVPATIPEQPRLRKSRSFATPKHASSTEPLRFT